MLQVRVLGGSPHLASIEEGGSWEREDDLHGVGMHGADLDPTGQECRYEVVFLATLW